MACSLSYTLRDFVDLVRDEYAGFLALAEVGLRTKERSDLECSEICGEYCGWGTGVRNCEGLAIVEEKPLGSRKGGDGVEEMVGVSQPRETV